jgi:hypothetical protein
MATSDECPGAGKCHGCLDWCSTCGEVRHVCDARLRGERCDQHPVPPTRRENLTAQREAEKMIREGHAAVREGMRLLNAATDREYARIAYDRQRAEQERRDFETTPGGE